MPDQPTCEGKCRRRETDCRGSVRRVRVRAALYDWGEFDYCQAAIRLDRELGFEVTVVGGEHQPREQSDHEQ